ncbi:hypothetical protein [Paracoccus sulfuroxidans]|uniref:Uncharacterized protein n=1 Tax=Paracoccus sulfuroxidans TaxID=384678 RepID=A0A562NAW0_9RHOB|nr:hypothetical protein [Paracoccus sulfuroxidans]TWI29233.1 hypothetical protein IQ24_03712 [Paracoccus sulfuroxidans]
MPDIPDTVADSRNWKPLPVPTGPVNLICQVAPIRITFKAAPSGGFILPVGKALRLKAGDAGHIKAAEALGGVAVFEAFG